MIADVIGFDSRCRRRAKCYYSANMAAGPRPLPSTSFEEALWAAGARLVAGVDEVGRGPLAGPVYAAAVILDPESRPGWIGELRDSKVLSAPERERLSQAIRQEAPAFGVGWATVPEIDAWGISLANRMAMVRALQALANRPQHVLIDGPARLPNYAAPQRAIVDGDALCCSDRRGVDRRQGGARRGHVSAGRGAIRPTASRRTRATRRGSTWSSWRATALAFSIAAAGLRCSAGARCAEVPPPAYLLCDDQVNAQGSRGVRPGFSIDAAR